MGGLRASAQMISYELALVLAVIGVVLVSGTLRPVEIVRQQAGWFTNWNIFGGWQLLGFLIFVVLIWRDDKYGLIEWHQNRKFGRTSHIGFTNPDFVKFAESFGARGYRVESAGELVPVLRQALGDGTVSVIDCPVDYSENMKLTEELGNLHLRI